MQGESISIILSPSDLLHLLVIKNLVERGNSQRDVNKNAEAAVVPFKVMCFLSDILDPPRSMQYESLDEFMKLSRTELGGACHDFVQTCTDLLVGLEGVDDVMNFFDNIKGILWTPEEDKKDMNGLSAPTSVCGDSFLGLYVRSCLVRWEGMSFNAASILFEACRAFTSEEGSSAKKYSAFNIPADTTQAGQFPLSDVDDIVVQSSFSMSTPDGSSHHLQCAHAALLREDFAAVEDSIHSYFDCGPLPMDSLHIPGPGTADTLSAHAYRTALDNFVSAASSASGDQNRKRSRHQKALVALVAMWARGGYHELAMRGINEAMKISHQRGDHAAVTESLLLLHLIKVGGGFDGGGGSNSADLTKTADVSKVDAEPPSEEVLQRCLRRCCALRLKSLGIQAALLLADLRLKRLPDTSERMLRSLQRQDHLIDPTHSELTPEWRFCGSGVQSIVTSSHSLWKILAAAMYGDLHLMTTVVNSSLFPVSDGSHRPAGKGPSPPGPQLVNAAKDGAEAANAVENPLSEREYCQFAAQHGAVTADLWARVGLPDMADLSLRRALRLISPRDKPADYINLVCKLLFNRVDLARREVSSKMVPDDTLEAAMKIVQRMRASLSSALPASVENLLTTTQLYVTAVHAIMNGDYERGLRLGQRLLDCALTPAEIDAFFDCSTTEAEGSSRRASLSTLSLDQTRICVLYAETISHFDIKRGNALMRSVRGTGLRLHVPSTVPSHRLDPAASHQGIRVAIDDLLRRLHDAPLDLAFGDRV